MPRSCDDGTLLHAEWDIKLNAVNMDPIQWLSHFWSWPLMCRTPWGTRWAVQPVISLALFVWIHECWLHRISPNTSTVREGIRLRGLVFRSQAWAIIIWNIRRGKVNYYLIPLLALLWRSQQSLSNRWGWFLSSGVCRLLSVGRRTSSVSISFRANYS